LPVVRHRLRCGRAKAGVRETYVVQGAAMEPNFVGPPVPGRHSARKCFSIMLPIWIEATNRRGWDEKNARMWGRLHRPPYDCGTLKNFVPSVEPSAASTRPTLRDGL
jgi:hypothetical protein